MSPPQQPRILQDEIGGTLNRWRLEGLFHACRSLRDAEAEFGSDEATTNLDHMLRVRECLQSALEHWLTRLVPRSENEILPMLRTQLQLDFNVLQGPSRAIADRCLALFDRPALSFPDQMAMFHEWGRQAAWQFWEHLWQPEHQPRHVSVLELDGALQPRMSFRPGYDHTDHRLIVSLRFLTVTSETFDYLRWYMLLPLYFMHEYVSHVYPIDLRNESFQEGWLLGVACCFLASSFSTTGYLLTMPKTHAMAYDDFDLESEIPRPSKDVVRAARDFWAQCNSMDLRLLMEYLTLLALIPETATAWERKRASRFVEELRKHQKDPLKRSDTSTNVSSVLRMAWDATSIAQTY